MVVQGSFFGMGYLPRNLAQLSERTVAEYIKPYKENSYIRALLLSHASNFPAQIRMLGEG